MNNPSSNVKFDESTKILMFLEGQARNYANHREVMKILYSRRRYPKMRHYFLKKGDHNMQYEFLIVKTGSREEFSHPAAISHLKEAVETVIPGGGFAAIQGEGNVADTADPGQFLTSTSKYESLRSAIENGAYSIEEILEY
ncbi:MAG: hypothetical protein HY043_11265 [Verrucomicrobia bacterium]|nr:hypothetical protein [Verrucomicrobiota bacterium]